MNTNLVVALLGVTGIASVGTWITLVAIGLKAGEWKGTIDTRLDHLEAQFLRYLNGRGDDVRTGG